MPRSSYMNSPIVTASPNRPTAARSPAEASRPAPSSTMKMPAPEAMGSSASSFARKSVMA